MSRSRLVNSLLWQRHLAQEDFVVGRIVNDERTRLGLTPLRHAADGRTGPGTVLAVDPVFARLPADLAGEGSGIRQAHYWYHEGDDPAPDPETVRFLDAGEPPILVSLGSADLVMKDAAATYARLCETLTGLGHRVLLVSSQPLAVDFRGAVHRAPYLPHAKVMPRCGAVIHHGGIGTVFASARAGVRQLAVPRMLDQFFWAARVSEMQIGYGPLPASDLDGPMVGSAVTQLLADDLVAQRARAIGDALAGTGRATEVDAALRDIFSLTAPPVL